MTFKRLKNSGTAIALAAFALNGAAMAQEAEAEATTEAAAPAAAADEAPTTTILQSATTSPELSTLADAVAQAELAATLSGPGPFTVFAPNNDAFALIPQATLAALMQDAAKAQLTQILTYHVVPGELDLETLLARIEESGGQLELTTVEGSPITLSMVNGALAINDERGGVAYMATPDMRQTNGIVHVVNGVLVPNPPEPAAAADASADTAPAEAGAEAEAAAEADTAAGDEGM